MQMLTGRADATDNRKVPSLATVGMLMGVFSLLTICVLFFSLPMAITAVILGHMGLSTIRKNQATYQGEWQAIIALLSGYTTLALGTFFVTFALLAPWILPRNDEFASNATTSQRDDDALAGNKSTIEALRSAENTILGKRGEAAGRGNTPEAIELANDFAKRMKLLSDEIFSQDRKPLLELSGGEYLTYCQLQEDRCLFLVHVPSYRNFTPNAKEALENVAWVVAQRTVATKLPRGAKLGVALRGVVSYGSIRIGDCAASDEKKVQPYTSGKRTDLLEFFEKSPKQSMSSDALAGSTAPTDAADSAALDALNNLAVNAKPNVNSADSSSQPMLARPPLPDLAQGASAGTGVGIGVGSEQVPVPSTSISTSPAPVPNAETSNANSGVEPQPEPPRKRPERKINFENQISIKAVATLENETWGTESMAFSPDGKWLATGKMDDRVEMYDVRTGDSISQVDKLNELGQVKAIAFSNSGERLIAGGYKGQVLSWQVAADGRLVDPMPLHRFESEVNRLITSPKHQFFIASTRKGSLAWQAFGANRSQPRLLTTFTKAIEAVWLPTEGPHGMATDGVKLVKFSLRDGEVVESKELGEKYIQLAAFSRSGKRLAIMTFDAWYVIDTEGRQPKRTIKFPKGERGHSLVFHPNDRWLAAGGRGKVAIIDCDKADVIAYANTETIFQQNNLTISRDGKLLATCSDSARDPIKVFEIGD